MSLVAFISHPLGDRLDDPVAWHDNLANASEWIRFVIDTTTYVVQAPWFVYALVHQDVQKAGRRLVDSLTAMERSDVLLQCGGYLSPHMINYDAKTARRLGLPIVDLTSFGVTPPDKTDESAIQLINARVRGAIKNKPRRVWMPLLTAEDIDAFKKARHALYTHVPGEPGEYNTAVALIDRILHAATERGNGG